MSLPSIDRLQLWDQLARASASVAQQALPLCSCAACLRERARRAPLEDAAAAADIGRVLDQCHPTEVLMLRDALARGVVDGRCFSTCLLGIVALLRNTTYDKLPFADMDSPIERWATRVQFTQTPANSADAARLDGWLAAWLDAHTLEWEYTPAAVLQV